MQFSSFTLLAWVAARSVLGGQLDDICWDARGVIDCDTIQLPIGQTPKFCGSVQCGITVLTEDVNMCTAINDVLPNTEFTQNAYTYCNCLADAIEDSNLKDVWQDGSLQAGAYPWKLDHAYYKEGCLADAGFTLKNNKKAAIGTTFQTKDGWKALQAPEINIPKYRSLVEVLNPCVDRTEDDPPCDWAPVRDWFVGWVDDADLIRDSDLARIVASWPSVVTTLKKRIADVKSAAKLVATRRKSTATKVAAVQKKICAKNACKGLKGKTASTFLGNVATTLKTTKDLETIPSGADKAANMIPKMAARAKDANNAFKVMPSVSHWQTQFEKGEIKSFKSIMKGFGRLIQDLPAAANQLKNDITHLVLLTKRSTGAKKAASQIKTVLTPKFKDNKELAKTKAGRQVASGFTQIQDIIKKDLKTPVDKLVTAISALNTDLNKLQVRAGKLQLTHGAVGYDRFNTWDFDYPCVQMVTEQFTDGQWTEEFTYPVYSACFYDSGTVNFVRNWIPYLKYRFA